jgi:putative transposase
MSHSFTKIWIHGVFGTKNRQPSLKLECEGELYNHIRDHLQHDFNCTIQSINGTSDHLHILFLLDPNYSVKDVFKNIKGESSHWLNSMGFLREPFSWQTGYGAFSVSDSEVKDIEAYITNQKQHHIKTSFSDEVDLFIKKYGLSFINR